MNDYLTDATDFTDMVKNEKPVNKYSDMEKYSILCPKCQGYGGWNLTLNAYGSGNHFQAHCNQCNGWGWVTEEDAACIHDYKEVSQQDCNKRGIGHYGMCWHVYECQKCNRLMSQDSSD